MHSWWLCPGSDYSQASIDLAKAVARRRGMTGVKWVVGDVLQSSVSDRYKFPATFLKGARQDGVLALEAFPHLNGLAISSWTAFQGMKECKVSVESPWSVQVQCCH